jgi:hypothetical protein
VYEALGVRTFRRLATNGDLINRVVRRHHPGYRVVRGPAALTQYFVGTSAGEKWHLVLLLMGTCTAAYAARIGWVPTAMFLTLTNIVFNLYPVLLQRYTRARITKIIAHQQHDHTNGKVERHEA